LISAFIVRSYQVNLIEQDIAKCSYPYIIAGDFNDTPNSYAVNELSNEMKNAFIEQGAVLALTIIASSHYI